jgi:hypothetical protein
MNVSGNHGVSSPQWIRSSVCDSSACIEVSFSPDDVLIRDSKDPAGPLLRFDLDEWQAFRLGLLAGDFDAPGRRA